MITLKSQQNSKNKIRSNIISTNITKQVQRDTLHILADSLYNSFGPLGSTTAITNYIDQNQTNVSVTHSKDGYTIVKNIQFLGPIERSVQDLITDMTRYIVKKVGDGTTSCILLSNYIFDALCDINFGDNCCPSDIIRSFSKRITEINKRILNLSRECTLDDTYYISLISTNGNKDISKTLYRIYQKYGLDVYIDVGVCPEERNIVKEYDGMTLETGYGDISFVNDRSNNTCRISNPRIYAFQDPIDTPEMIRYLDIILERNILSAFMKPSSPQLEAEKHELIPTVILCKKITSDASSHLESIIKLMNQYPGKIPLLIVNEIHQEYLFEDIVQMCGCKWIKKYLNPDLQKQDQDNGLAPTEETIQDFYGSAEEVRSDQLKTQFIKPKDMFNEDGSFSEKYNTILEYLRIQIEKAKSEGAGINEIATVKRRYNSFKGNMVDFLIGGVTLSDREALKASVEDAVMNIRSSVTSGVGYGSNYMAFKVIREMILEDEYKNDPYIKILNEAYYNMIKILYEKSYPNNVDHIIKECIIVYRE